MIHAAGVRVRLGTNTVLDGIDLDVRSGERIALLGLNGAGKTTMIRCLLGLAPFRGTLTIGGHDVRRAGREARSLIGYVPQRPPHFDGTLVEMVRFLALLRGTDPRTVARRLATLGLPLAEHGRKVVRALSGGMLQKLLLALALAEDNPVLLLDEPTANLDAPARREFLRTLSSVGPETTVVLASHRLADVEAVADRLVVLHAGRLVFDGPREALGNGVALSTLWVRVPGERREEAEARLRRECGVSTMRANGAALGVSGDPQMRADIIVALRSAGIPVEHFWVDTASLHDVLEHVLGGEGAPCRS